MPVSAAIKPPESLSQALEPIVTMSDEEFEKLLKAVSGARSFSLTKSQIEELTKDIPVTAANLPYTLGTLAFLYSQISQLMKSPEDEAAIIVKLVDELDEQQTWSEHKDLMRSRMNALLARRASHQEFTKTKRLRDGFIPNATGFSSFVDIRPNYNDGDPDEIVGLLPIVQLRISTDADHPSQRRFVLQLDEEALEEMKKAIEHIETKLAVLRADDQLAPRLRKL